MYYLAWKFLLLQVFDQPDEMETGGLYFPMAINNLFVGLYIEQVCLACLFFLKASGSPGAAIAQGAVMLVLLGITALAQMSLNHSYSPLIKYLPMSLATQKMAQRYEKQRKERHEATDDEDDEMDLFNRTALRSVRRRIKNTTKKLDNTLDTIKSNLVGESSAVKVREDIDSPKTSEDTVAEATGMKGAPELYRMKSFESTASRASQTSKASKASKKSKGSKKGKDKDAKWPKHAVFDPAAQALMDDSDEEDDDDVHAFDHPSTYVDQPWIWIPKDQIGLSSFLVKELQDAGVSASDLGAEIREDGIVEVSRNPPDEDWSGGHDS